MKAAVYARYSSDNQNICSIDAQIRAIREYCDKNDIVIVKTYIDEALTATNDDREAFLEMVEHSSEKKFDTIIVHKLDRFARNRYDSSFYKKKLQDNGVRVVSVLEFLDDSPESIILESVLEGMAEYYSKNLAREVRKGMKENALKAKHNGGIPPLGYDVTPEKYYSINEKEAEAVKLIFKLYLDNAGYSTIASELNKRGYRSKRGTEFSKVSIRDILLNEKYTGTYIFGKKDKHGKLTGKEIRVENALPVIIPMEMFQRVIDMFGTKKYGPHSNAKVNYLLTGFLECGECGLSYVGGGRVKGRTKYYHIYVCSSRNRKKSCDNMSIRKELIEGCVLKEIKENIFKDELINEIAHKILDYIKTKTVDNKKDLKRISDLAKETKIKIDKLLDAYLDGAVNKSVLAEKTNKLKADLDMYNEQIVDLQETDYDYLNEKKIKAFYLDFKSKLEGGNEKDLRSIIELFVHKVILNKTEIKVTLKFDSLLNIKVDSDGHGGGEAHSTLSLSKIIKKKSLFIRSKRIF